MAEYPENLEHKRKLYRHKESVHSFDPNGYLIRYYNDAEGGQSGAPVIYSVGRKYYVVGIHTGNYGNTLNQGRYISKNVYTLVNKYR